MVRLPFLLVLLFLPAGLAVAAEYAPLYSSTQTLELTLHGPFRAIDRERDREQEYERILSYLNDAGEAVELDATFEVRGNFRLRTDVCRYSQLWMDLRRSQLPGTLFEGQNRLKLVVQCRPGNSYQDYVVKEFLAYRIFQLLEEPGFGVRLVNVTYDYTDREGETRTHLGVIIEHQDTVAERFGHEGVEENTVPITQLGPREATLVALFMMLIGNTDFSLVAGPEGDECCHNAKLLDTGEFLVPIPYDFDSSGFVDASYAAEPNPAFGIRNNRQRLFRGYCVHNDQVTQVIPAFLSVREEVLALVADDRLSSPREAQEAQDYIARFFEIIGDPDEIEDDILDDCRG